MAITCGIYLYDLRQKKFLICHATHARWDQWSIPKGGKEKDEDTLTAAVRELKEETGIRLSDLHVIDTHVLPSVKYQKQNKTLEPFLLLTDTDLSNYKLHCPVRGNDRFAEVDTWKWVDIDIMEKMVHESQQKNIPAIRKLLNEFSK
jgi:8-oxo-dGTP pyrophosphatase MutT (NUDIX family)